MSQATPTIPANQSGLVYRGLDNDGKNALMTTHKGPAAPSYAAAGIIWLDDNATPWVLKIYDGTDWLTIGTVNATTNVVTLTLNNDDVTYAKIQNISATQRVLGRNTAGAGDTEEVTLTQLLDWIGSAAQGDILYRGAASWARLGAGTANQVLKTGGAAANPSWSDGREVITLTPSASQDNYSTGIATSLNVVSTVRIAPSNTIKITGVSATSVANGKVLRIVNSGDPAAAASRLLLLERESASSTAANRLHWAQGCPPMALMPSDWVEFEYDTTLSRWRFVRGNRNFDSVRGNFDRFSDYMGGIGADYGSLSSGTGAAFFSSAAFGTDTTQRTIGVGAPGTGTTSTGKCFGQSSSSTTSLTTGGMLFMSRVCPEILSDGTETFQIRCGFHDSSDGTDVVDGVYWEYDSTTSTDWRTCTSNNSTRTKNTVTGFTASITVLHTLGVFVNYDGTQADFFYLTGADAVTIFATSITTNLPTSARAFAVSAGINKTVGTTARFMDIDWMGDRMQIKRGA